MFELIHISQCFKKSLVRPDAVRLRGNEFASDNNIVFMKNNSMDSAASTKSSAKNPHKIYA